MSIEQDLFDFQKELEINTAFSEENSVTLYLGNCLDFLGKIPNGCIQLIVTSPPYNIGKEYEKRLDIEEYVAQQSQVINECSRILREGGSICWETGNYVDNLWC